MNKLTLCMQAILPVRHGRVSLATLQHLEWVKELQEWMQNLMVKDSGKPPAERLFDTQAQQICHVSKSVVCGLPQLV